MKNALKFLWLGLLSAGILSNPMLSYPGRDSGIFLYIGSLILKGKIPYVDVWENKGPLVFYLNALGLGLTGDSRWGIWLLEFLFVFAAGYIVYRLLEKRTGEVSALMGTSVFILAAGNVLQGGNFSEEYSLPFSALALFLFFKDLEEKEKTWRINNLLVGATLGANLLLRPNNVSAQAAVAGTYFLLTLFSKDWKSLLRRAIEIAAGALTVLLPVLLYFHGRDALSEMINVVIVFNSQYSKGVDEARIVEGALNAAQGIGLGWVVLALFGYALSFAALVKNKKADSPQGGLSLALLLGFPLEALLSSVSGKNYPHYFIGWSLYVGLLSGYAASFILARLPEKIKAEKRGCALTLFLLFFLIFAKLETWQNYAAVLTAAARHAPIEYRDPVADYVAQRTAPNDKVLVWGFRPIINFVAQRETPVVYLPYPLSHVDTPLAHRWADEFFAQLQADPPALIINMIEDADRERIPDLDPQVRKAQKIKWKDVVLAYNYKEVLAFIAERYEKTGAVNGCDIYQLK